MYINLLLYITLAKNEKILEKWKDLKWGDFSSYRKTSSLISMSAKFAIHNWMAWCKSDLGKRLCRVNCFPFKSAWIFACASQLCSKTFPCIFFGWFVLCFWENDDKILKCAQWTQQSRTRIFSLVVLCIIVFGTIRNFFSFLCSSFKKSQALLMEKNSPKKVS